MKIAVVENLNADSAGAVRELLRQEYEIRYFKTGGGAGELANDQRVAAVDWSIFPGGDRRQILLPCERQAMADVGPAFAAGPRRTLAVTLAKRLYRSDAVELYFKKHLLAEIAECRIIHLYLTLLPGGADRTVALVADRYPRTARALQSLNLLAALPAGIRVIETRSCRPGETLRRLFKAGKLIAVLGLNWLRGAARGRTSPNPQRPTVGIRSYRNDYSIDTGKLLNIDFLVDGRRIRKADVVFLLEPGVPAATRRKFEARGYATHELGRLRRPLGPVSGSEITTLAALLLAGLLAPGPEAEKTLEAATIFLQWKACLAGNEIRKYISYNDLAPAHILKNAMLKTHGVETFSFIHSGHTLDVFERNDERGAIIHNHFAIFTHDHLVTFGKHVSDFIRRHEHRIGRFHELGCLFSELIPPRAKLPAGRPVVALFDTTFGSVNPLTGGSFIRREDYEEFLRAAIRLAQEKPEYAWRLKKKLDFQDWDDPHAAGPRSLYEELRHQGTVEVCDWAVDQMQVIGSADLVVSLAFTSTTVEALGAGRKAIYYDPLGRYRETIYDECPRLVAHSYPELQEYIDYWLALGEDEFKRYLAVYVTPKIDPYCDGRGLQRFRELLVSAGRDPVPAGVR